LIGFSDEDNIDNVYVTNEVVRALMRAYPRVGKGYEEDEDPSPYVHKTHF
jgi:hypothetical protein